MNQKATVLLSDLLDDGPWRGFQKRILMLGAGTIMLDGLDNQLLGFTIPALIREWGATRGDFVPVVALSLAMMSVGTMVAGIAGDRFGRKPALIASVLIFGLATLAGAFTGNVLTFTITRLISAFGLGGAMPNASALLAEFTPRQRRSFAVAAGSVCVPVGGTIAGLIAAGVLPTLGWRALYIVCGVAPLVMAAVLALFMPESPRYLAARADKRRAFEKVLARYGVDDPTPFVQASGPEAAKPRARIRDLFAAGLGRDTLLLWTAFFATLTAAYCVFNWAPTLLASLQFDLSVSSTGLAAFNIGGILGALAGAGLMDRLGTRRVTLVTAGGGLLVCVVAALASVQGLVVLTALAALFGAGLFIAGLQPMLYAVGAYLFPAEIRATGLGSALAIGRVGAVASAVVGAILVGIGPWAFFVFLGLMMAIALAALAGIRRHVPHASLKAE